MPWLEHFVGPNRKQLPLSIFHLLYILLPSIWSWLEGKKQSICRKTFVVVLGKRCVTIKNLSQIAFPTSIYRALFGSGIKSVSSSCVWIKCEWGHWRWSKIFAKICVRKARPLEEMYRQYLRCCYFFSFLHHLLFSIQFSFYLSFLFPLNWSDFLILFL